MDTIVPHYLDYIMKILTNHSQHVTDASSLSVQEEAGEESNLHWRITRYAEVEQFTPLSTVRLESLPNLYSIQLSCVYTACHIWKMIQHIHVHNCNTAAPDRKAMFIMPR